MVTNLVVFKDDNEDFNVSFFVKNQEIKKYCLLEFLKVVFLRKKVFFTKSIKKRHKFIYILAFILGLKWGQSNELKAILNIAEEAKTLAFILNSYEVQEIFKVNFTSVNDYKKFFFTMKNSFKLNFYLKKYLALFYLKLIKPNLSKNINILIANEVNPLFLKLIRYKYPNANLILRFYDEVSESDFDKTSKAIDIAKHLGYLVESYSRNNANALGMDYYPDFVDEKYLRSLLAKVDKIEDRVLFVGNADNNRFDRLIKLANYFVENNIDFLFYLTNIDNDKKKIIDTINSKFNRNKIIINKPITYSRYIDLVIKSSKLLDLYRIKPDEGYSFRVAEAIIFNKKLITDRFMFEFSKYTFNNDFLYLDFYTSSDQLQYDDHHKNFIKLFYLSEWINKRIFQY